MTRMGTQYGTGSRTCQPVNNHGIRPATMPGPTTKNTALPSAAVGLRMVSRLTFWFIGRRSPDQARAAPATLPPVGRLQEALGGAGRDRSTMPEHRGLEVELGEGAETSDHGGAVFVEDHRDGSLIRLARSIAASPTESTLPSRSSRNAQCPSVWPGVWTTRIPPASGSS